MRAGLAALAQAWLDDVALPRFRWPSDTLPVALDAWFDSPQALLYIKVLARRISSLLCMNHGCMPCACYPGLP